MVLEKKLKMLSKLISDVENVINTINSFMLKMYDKLKRIELKMTV